jgi:hypothetical protein
MWDNPAPRCTMGQLTREVEWLVGDVSNEAKIRACRSGAGTTDRDRKSLD